MGEIPPQAESMNMTSYQILTEDSIIDLHFGKSFQEQTSDNGQSKLCNESVSRLIGLVYVGEADANVLISIVLSVVPSVVQQVTTQWWVGQPQDKRPTRVPG